jgi:ribosomal-protein-alanine N-acetyltransferase
MPRPGDNVRLIPADIELVDAELDDVAMLAQRLGVRVPDDYPPEHHDGSVLRFTREQLARGGQQEGWWLHYIVVDGADRPTLVGTCGYKGPPRDGVVEIGYSVVPSWRRQGIATAAVRGLIQHGGARGVTAFVADTLPHLEASIGVLRTSGFVPHEPPEPGVLRFRRDA